LAKLGIAAAVAAKVKLTSGPVAELVARGEAELGMQQIIAILPVAGAELVGPLPAELQNVIIYAAGFMPLDCRRARPMPKRRWFSLPSCVARKQNSSCAPRA
jgi:hypothetical protein